MPTTKVAITVDEQLLRLVDRWVTQGRYPSRSQAIQAAVREELLTRHDLFNAQECFLTGTAAEIVPVVTIDGRTIGRGTPGPVTKRLQQGFRQLTKTEGIRY